MFFDDDYDYLQHLKEPSGPSELIPTSTVSVPSRRNDNEETSVISVRLSNNLCEKECVGVNEKDLVVYQYNFGQETGQAMSSLKVVYVYACTTRRE